MTFADIAAFFDVGLDRANQFYAWGWRASIVGALVTFFGIGFLYWGTRVRDHDFENQMTKLNSEAAKARELAGNLEVRAAGLENEAAQARLEQERLKAQLAWRVISPDAATKLEQRLVEAPGSVNVQFVAGDPEAQALAIRLANIFDKAKWKIAMNGLSYTGTVVFGLWIPDPATTETILIRDAFTAAGATFDTSPLPPAGMGLGGTIPDAPIIFVGSKPPPK